MYVYIYIIVFWTLSCRRWKHKIGSQDLNVIYVCGLKIPVFVALCY